MKLTFSTVAMLATLTGVAHAQAPASAFTPEQQARIGQIAGDYLLAHPEILVQVSQKLQVQQQQRAQTAMAARVMENQAALLADPSTPSVGPKAARVAVIEFFDYQCVFCSRLAPELEKVMQGHHEVRYVFKDWPIFASRWPASHDAAVRGLNIWKAKGPAAYMAFHNGIYRTGHDEGALTPADIDAATRTVMKGTPLASGTDSDSVLEANNQLTQKLGLTGTPGLIVMPVDNPTPDTITVLPGAVPVAQIEAAIRRAGGKAMKS